MPLSISNFKTDKLMVSNVVTRLPRQGWARIWLVVLLLLVTSIAGWEGFWRLQGFVPNLSDDLGIWALVRRRASHQGSHLVLIGASRIQLGLNPQAFALASGISPLMLAIDGSSPLPVLADLATDPAFRGKVIVSLTPMHLAVPLDRDRAVKWVRKYTQQQWSQRLETRLRMAVQQQLVLRSTSLSPEKLWQHWQEGTWPTMFYAPMRPDRSRVADFSQVDLIKMRRSRAKREEQLHAMTTPLSTAALEERIAYFRSLVKTIQGRGGDVVFIRFPSGGEVLALEQRDWPRTRYWNRFADQVGALTIHFQDEPRIRHFATPDGSHLDGEDAKRFSQILAEILLERQFL